MIDLNLYLKSLVSTKNNDYICFYLNNNYTCYFSDKLIYSDNQISFDNAEKYNISISDENEFFTSYNFVNNSSIDINNAIYSNVIGIADINSDINLIRKDLSSLENNSLYLSCILFTLVLSILVGFVHHFFKIGGND